jgi:ADP-ribose pyrophosphatase
MIDRNANDTANPLTAYEITESDVVYKGRIVQVRRDKIKMPAGNVATREVVETTDAVAMVALDTSNNICLIRQYRHPQRDFVWELPAGRMDKASETALETARRELEEEVQLTSETWTKLATSISSPGFASERIHIFLAENVRRCAAPAGFEARNEERGIVIEMRSLRDAVADVLNGSIADSKTALGILLAGRRTL